MLDTKQLDRLWDDEDFHALVHGFVEHIQRLHIKSELEAYTVNSALLFANALYYESSPYFESDKSLKEAEALSIFETRLMFKYLRNYKKETGWNYLNVILSNRMSGTSKAAPN